MTQDQGHFIFDFYGKQSRYRRFILLNKCISDYLNEQKIKGIRGFLRRLFIMLVYSLIVRNAKFMGLTMYMQIKLGSILGNTGIAINIPAIPPKHIRKRMHEHFLKEKQDKEELVRRAANIRIFSPFINSPTTQDNEDEN